MLKFLLKRSVSTVILFIIFFSYEGFVIISIDFFFLLLASPLRLWRFWREQFKQGWTGTGDNLFDAATLTQLDALYQFFLFFNGFSIDCLLINRYYKIPSIVLKVQRTSRVFSFTDQRKICSINGHQR